MYLPLKKSGRYTISYPREQLLLILRLFYVISFIAWNLVSGYYNNLPYGHSSLMTANQPWSGHYQVAPTIWTTGIVGFIGLLSMSDVHRQNSSNYPVNTKHVYNIMYNVGPTSKTLSRRCTNVIHFLCLLGRQQLADKMSNDC